MTYQMEELFFIVKKLSEKYTGKSSSSVTYETAEQLMEAVLYCIHENDLTQADDGTRLMDPSASMTAQEAYDAGYATVIDKTKTARQVYNDLAAGFCHYGNTTYEDTVLRGIPEFFKWYDPKFQPQNHLLTLDYPVLENLQGFRGIDLILKYLKCIQTEQSYLDKFSKTYVKDVLTYSHPDASKLLINIPEVVTQNILANLLIHSNPPTAYFAPNDFESIGQISASLNVDALSAKLDSLLEIFIQRVFPQNADILFYLQPILPGFSIRLKSAGINGCLENVLGGNPYESYV